MRADKTVHAVVVFRVDETCVKNIHHVELGDPGGERADTEGKFIGCRVEAVVYQLGDGGRRGAGAGVVGRRFLLRL